MLFLSLIKLVSLKRSDLIKQVNNISSISEIRYADGSMISYRKDLLRTSVSSDAISDNPQASLSLQIEDLNTW